MFNGDGYSEEWVEEARRRGLPNLASMVDAVAALKTDKAEKLFTKFNIYTKAELLARAEIMYETYIKVLTIEAKTMIHMAAKHYIPSAIHYTTRLGQSIAAVKSAGVDVDLSVQTGLLEKVSTLLGTANQALGALKALMAQVESIQNVEEMAEAYRSRVAPAMTALRRPIDELEMTVDKDLWPVPTYGDLMFEV